MRKSTFLIEKEKIITYQNTPGLVFRILTLCLSTFYFGYCLVYFSTFLPQTTIAIYGTLAVKTSFNSVLVGIFTFGAIFGAGGAPLIMRFFSRKQFVLLMNIVALIVQGIIQIPNVYVFLVCRFFQGVLTGNYLAIIPIYINELCPKQIVGSLGVFVQLTICFAIVFCFGIGLAMQSRVSDQAFYRIMVTLPSAFIIIQSLALIFNYVPESPNSLLAKNRKDEAREVIGMFVKEQYVQQALRQKETIVASQSAASSKNSQQNSQKINYHWSAYMIGFQIPLMQQMSGVNAIVTASRIIVGTVLPGLAPEVPMIINAFTFFGALGTIYLLDFMGRRTITLFGNLSLALLNFGIGVLLIFGDWQPSGIFILVLLILYMFIFGLTVGPVTWLYVPEIVPSKIVPLATMMNWLGGTICIIFAPIAIQQNNGNPSNVFFFFGAITFAFFIVNVIFMKQTKGKTAVQIAKLFHGKSQ